MTARPAPVRPKRRLIKPLVGVILTLMGVFAPVESVDLPGPLDDLTKGSHANAQTPPPPDWVPGNAASCPTAPVMWDEQGANCILETHACPESALTGTLMRLSAAPSGLQSQLDPNLDIEYAVLAGLVRYPEFCEERIPSSDALHAQCTASTGYAVLEYDDQDSDGVAGCRLVYPVTCAAGMHQIGARTCRAVQRRTWTCRTGYAPRNEFNECYLIRYTINPVHPACGTGAPELTVISCVDYVGTDFLSTPSTVDCRIDYDAGTALQLAPNSRSGTSSDHWCEFEAAFLKVECHSLTPPPGDCATDTALCLKRITVTGGCSLIAETIRCRQHQWDFSQGTATQQQVQDQGCEPCAPLPFEPVPAHCPAELSTDAPSGLGTAWLARYRERLLEEKIDIAIGHSACSGFANGRAPSRRCLDAPTCADPPRGRLDWHSSHFSQLAVINAPVILSFEDIGTRRGRFYSIRMYRGDVSVTDGFRSFDYHTDSTGFSDQRVRTFSEPDPSTSYSYVHEMVDSECLLRYEPYLRVRLEELWPDDPDHRTAITQLFGNDALAWWNDLAAIPGAQQRRTEARGLNYWGTLLTTAEQDQERQDRSARFTEEIDCNSLVPRWCRWTPRHPGFYRIQGIGAWVLARTRYREFGITILSGLHDDIRTSLSSQSKRDQVRQWLNRRGLTPEQVGLRADLMGPLELPPAADPAGWLFPTPPPGMDLEDWAQTTAGEVALNEWLYSEAAARTPCVSLDLRVLCGGTHNVGNYTETEPIGMMVHEMRVSTVTPGT